MKKTILAAVALSLCLMSNGVARAEKKMMTADAVSKHMVAQATLTAHLIAAAIRAGMSKKEINAVLARVAAQTGRQVIQIRGRGGRGRPPDRSGRRIRGEITISPLCRRKECNNMGRLNENFLEADARDDSEPPSP